MNPATIPLRLHPVPNRSRMLCTVHLLQSLSVCLNLITFRNKGSCDMPTSSSALCLPQLATARRSRFLINTTAGKTTQFFVKLLTEKKIYQIKLLTTSRPMVTICTTAETLQHFPIKIIYVIHMSLTINSRHFSWQHQTPGLSKEIRLCSLQASNWSPKCVIQMSISLQRVKKSSTNTSVYLSEDNCCIWRFYT